MSSPTGSRTSLRHPSVLALGADLGALAGGARLATGSEASQGRWRNEKIPAAWAWRGDPGV